MPAAGRTFLETLNEPQRAAVLHWGSPLLILAGAGSGKTRVITTKVAYLIESGRVGARDILAVTFTNKAAGEMRERARGMTEAASDVLIRTFHSFAAWFLRRNAEAAGLSARFSIYDDEDAASLLRSAFPDRDRRFYGINAAWISRAKDFALSPEDELSGITADPGFPEVYRVYETKLAAVGNLDFGGLILGMVRLLRTNDEARRRVRDRFRVVLVDEYQDSNVAQFELLKLLVGPDTYVCVVGDDDQSIYRFRGAEVKNILTFPETFPGTTVIRLDRNYRSTPSILEAASAVVSRNQGRLGKTLWTTNPDGPEPLVKPVDDEESEAAYCLSLINKDPGLETAILYRTNAQSRAFESLFVREGLPYTIIGSLRFYEREEVKDAVALLKLLLNPRDEVAFRRVINKPSRGLGDASLKRILEAVGPGGDFIEAAEASAAYLRGRAREAALGFAALLRRCQRQLLEGDLATFVAIAIRESGLAEFHRSYDEIAGTQKERNLEELVNAASIYDPGYEGLAEMLEAMELDRARTEAAAGGGRVFLLTMHNTKGLEFDRVIVTGMEDGLFPREESEDELEEERRLFYVAMTRARKQLIFTTSKTRRIMGRVQPLYPSRFLLELPERFRRGAPDRTEAAWRPGQPVYHENYGRGVVSKAVASGTELLVMVIFEGGRTLRFFPKYERRLERVEVDGL